MGDSSWLVTAAFGCVVATEAFALPGRMTPTKVLAAGSAVVVTLFLGLVVGSGLGRRR